MHFGTKNLNVANLWEQNYYMLNFKKDFVDILREFGRPHFPTIPSALQAWKDAKENGENTTSFIAASEEIKQEIETANQEVDQIKNMSVPAF